MIVEVMLKPEIHDPQGAAILGACHRLGFAQVTSVRQGKRFEVELDGPADDAALASVRKLAGDLLANPVIEEPVVYPALRRRSATFAVSDCISGHPACGQTLACPICRPSRGRLPSYGSYVVGLRPPIFRWAGNIRAVGGMGGRLGMQALKVAVGFASGAGLPGASRGKQRGVNSRKVTEPMLVPDVKFCLAFGCEEMSVPAMRQVLGDTLRGLGVSEESVYDILLAVTEACTNVLGHGRQAQHWTVVPWRVAVCTSLSGARCQVEVTGPGRRLRSLSVARACVDNVTLRRRPGRGTVVTLRKHITWSWDAPLHRLAAAG